MQLLMQSRADDTFVSAAAELRQRGTTYVGPAGRHEDGEVREVVAGAGGGAAVDVQRLAPVGGPAALQAVRLVLPEGAPGHVGSSVDRLPGREKEAQFEPRSSHEHAGLRGSRDQFDWCRWLELWRDGTWRKNRNDALTHFLFVPPKLSCWSLGTALSHFSFMTWL